MARRSKSDSTRPAVEPTIQEPTIDHPEVEIQPEPRLCLCGCATPMTTKKGIFRQGHDARLKGMVLRGERIEDGAMAYAEAHWPQVVDRMGSRAPKAKAGVGA